MTALGFLAYLADAAPTIIVLWIVALLTALWMKGNME